MTDLFLEGRLVDMVIALTLLEALILYAHHAMTGRGLAPRDYALNMVSGLWLMLALRSALVAAGWVWVTLCLLAAGLAHGSDMWLRWKRRNSVSASGVRPS